MGSVEKRCVIKFFGVPSSADENPHEGWTVFSGIIAEEKLAKHAHAQQAN